MSNLEWESTFWIPVSPTALPGSTPPTLPLLLLDPSQRGRVLEGIGHFDRFYGDPARLSSVAAGG